ncbi:MAG: VPLPA-CTERM-specific exosortase XrtD [Pseudomonadota bacterium]
MSVVTDGRGTRAIGYQVSGSMTGPAILFFNLLLAVVVFREGFEALFEAWQVAEYSHGPLIPVLSGLLFLRQLKTVPIAEGPITDRWPGVLIIGLAIAMAMLGKFAQIPDIVAYSIIVWVAGILLVSFGWRTGRHFWPGVLHLVFMLPLPGLLYWKVSIFLRGIASEFGVYLVQLANVPVFLDGNIIDLGVYKLHVADACSGLRYLFPIMSFSYIFATLYRGPVWHKAVLLLSAAPITVLMNSVRIGMIGVLVNEFGIEHAMGFSHLMEGWVIFIACVLMLFGMAKVMLMMQRKRMTLAYALDLDTTGLKPQFMRIRNLRLSPAMMVATVLLAVAAVGWSLTPERGSAPIQRIQLSAFPERLGGGEWVRTGMSRLDPIIEQGLGADDYLYSTYARPDEKVGVDFFVAWYADQTKGGIHSPEVCLPAGGWEIATLDRPDVGPAIGLDAPMPVNRAVIEKGQAKMLVYYWFEQYGDRTAHDLTAKFNVLRDAIILGRSDGALVRLTTPILPNETVVDAEMRLRSLMPHAVERLPRFVPRHGVRL